MRRPFDCFISYNTRDRPVIDSIKIYLSGKKLAVWYDDEELQPGDNFVRMIKRGLEQAYAIIVCFGPNNLGEFQKKEIAEALALAEQKRTRLIPLILPDTPPPQVLRARELFTTTSLLEFAEGTVHDRARIDALCDAVRKAVEDSGEPDNASVPSADAAVGRPDELRTLPPTPPEPGKAPAAQDQTPSPADAALEAQPPGSSNGLSQAAAKLARNAANYGLTIVLGPFLGDAKKRPTPASVAGELLHMMGKEQRADPFGIPMDRACFLAEAYLQHIQNDANNPDNGRQMTDTVIDHVDFRAPRRPTEIQDIAEMLHRLSRGCADQGIELPRLVVSSFIDSRLETALMKRRCPFTRIVFHRALNKIEITEIEEISEDGDAITLVTRGTKTSSKLTDAEKERLKAKHVLCQNTLHAAGWSPDDLPPLHEFLEYQTLMRTLKKHSQSLAAAAKPDMAARTEPIIFRIFGTAESVDSMYLSSDCWIDWTQRISQIPDFVRSRLGESALLIVGHRRSEPSFLQQIHAFIGPQLKNSGFERTRLAVFEQADDGADPYAALDRRFVGTALLRQIEIEQIWTNEPGHGASEFLANLNTQLKGYCDRGSLKERW